MGNPHKGDVAFEAEGKAYTLRYSANAICELEDITDRGFLDVAGEMAAWAPQSDPNGNPVAETDEQKRQRESKIKVSLLRSVFWAGLQHHHPGLDLRAAGDVMFAAGGMSRGMELIGQAFERAFPAAETKGARPTEGSETSTTG